MALWLVCQIIQGMTALCFEDMQAVHGEADLEMSWEFLTSVSTSLPIK